MPWVGFEPTIPVFERAKTVHALDREATVISYTYITFKLISLIVYSHTLFHNAYEQGTQVLSILKIHVINV
jgi:hypothetical protein